MQLVSLADRIGITIDMKVPSSGDEVKTPVSKEVTHMKEAHLLRANYYHHLLLNTEEGEKALKLFRRKRIFERAY